MSVIYPSKSETEKIYKETQALEKQRQQISHIGERINNIFKSM